MHVQVQVRKQRSHTEPRRVTGTGITISSPQSRTLWTPVHRRDIPSSWPRFKELQGTIFLGGGPVHGPGSDIAESYSEQLDHEDRYSEMDSAGSYNPCPCLDDPLG
ncbi:hypothetical protein P4O66_022250 [Electrophorus voltai]|uniref:Uncharacterized protein n=1 Tax=Electrophorus voltai TaxID=2609070 RepID=A0AAD8ZPE8_9TELE|nr:hypothetical protein P4O66_022250 [Electrophorus voltai]